ncbi:MAG TPA: hypothetical protein ENK18_11415 [Deltaproteobacteria bacterium]|nr:hypothetical protein [Deltaproteobacteria bacterium]
MRVRYCATLALLTLPLGCNRYDLFRVAGYQQESFSNRADVLFVIDNSDSMVEVSESLAVNFAAFIDDLGTIEDTRSYEDLGDAVENYVDYVQNRTSFVDYQFAVTTTDVDNHAGKLLGGLVRRTDDGLADRFIKNLTCEATCFRDDLLLPQDPGYQCGDPLGLFLSEDYLDCVCDGDWQGHCGSAIEEGIEATFLAMCRAVPNPPLDCFEEIVTPEATYPAKLTPGDTLSNEGMLRNNSNFIVVVVSDEGDGSRRLERESVPDQYVNLFKQFGRRMTWVYIGPGLDENNQVICPGTATDWGVVRYNYMAYTTGGRVVDVFDDNCETQDFDAALGALGELLQNLLTSFPLQSVPVPGSVIVLVDGKGVDEATVVDQDQFGLDVYSDGWSYRSSDNSIEFHGGAIPPYDADVEVYYHPIDGIPRDLPF